ncbi:MAG: flavin reductase family protein, partial [Alphaproteobacteria bacterium]|nr:flavin reductase family protein [Alphaproteobacteria bacterium]
TGVTVITTRSAAGDLVGFTANSFSSVSLDPPLVLFSLNRQAQSLPIFESCAHFAVNILAEEQSELSSRFATAAHDKWDGVSITLGAGGCPLLDGAVAIFECAVHGMHDGGDHRIFIGRVLGMRAALEGKPLLFCRGAYRELGPPLGAPAAAAAPGATSALDNGGLFAGLEPWVSA